MRQTLLKQSLVILLLLHLGAEVKNYPRCDQSWVHWIYNKKKY